ncbi:hypothetical protein LTR17_000072 [Elasticomyces elasticus]|nr:hypothetical protein LTR17_000072 [Elasticomyces elasticus]
MANDRKSKRVKLSQEEEPEPEDFEKSMSPKEEKAARKLERKAKRTKKVVSKVFGIPELREIILLHLPLRQLLFARQISRDFLATIDTVKVRRALWLETTSGQRLGWEYRPGHVAGLRPQIGVVDTGNWVDKGEISTALNPHPIVNPFMFVLQRDNYDASLPRAGMLLHDGNGPDVTNHEPRYFEVDDQIAWVHERFLKRYYEGRSKASKLKATHRKGWSYAAMCFAHPPVETLKGYCGGDCYVDVEDVYGVRIGAFFDAVAQANDGFKCGEEIKKQKIMLETAQDRIQNLEENRKNIREGLCRYRGDYDDDDEPWKTEEYWPRDSLNAILEGGEKWQVLDRDIDEITGWDMLAIFEAGSEEAVYGKVVVEPAEEVEAKQWNTAATRDSYR